MRPQSAIVPVTRHWNSPSVQPAVDSNKHRALLEKRDMSKLSEEDNEDEDLLPESYDLSKEEVNNQAELVRVGNLMPLPAEEKTLTGRKHRIKIIASTSNFEESGPPNHTKIVKKGRPLTGSKGELQGSEDMLKDLQQLNKRNIQVASEWDREVRGLNTEEVRRTKRSHIHEDRPQPETDKLTSRMAKSDSVNDTNSVSGAGYGLHSAIGESPMKGIGASIINYSRMDSNGKLGWSSKKLSSSERFPGTQTQYHPEPSIAARVPGLKFRQKEKEETASPLKYMLSPSERTKMHRKMLRVEEKLFCSDWIKAKETVQYEETKIQSILKKKGPMDDAAKCVLYEAVCMQDTIQAGAETAESFMEFGFRDKIHPSILDSIGFSLYVYDIDNMTCCQMYCKPSLTKKTILLDDVACLLTPGRGNPQF